MSKDLMREQFEAWAMNQGYFNLRRDTDGRYKFQTAWAAWEGWQASREAVVVELPEPQQKPDAGASEYRQGKADGIESGIIQCIKAIERQGFKVEA